MFTLIPCDWSWLVSLGVVEGERRVVDYTLLWCIISIFLKIISPLIYVSIILYILLISLNGCVDARALLVTSQYTYFLNNQNEIMRSRHFGQYLPVISNSAFFRFIRRGSSSVYIINVYNIYIVRYGGSGAEDGAFRQPLLAAPPQHKKINIQ